jgi:hypothetical protein
MTSKYKNRIANDLLYQFNQLYQVNCPASTIVAQTGISRTTVYRILRNMDFWGTPYPPDKYLRPNGRQPKLLEVHQKVRDAWRRGVDADYSRPCSTTSTTDQIPTSTSLSKSSLML